MKTIGNCVYCNDPIYDFQATHHDGCSRLEEVDTLIEWLKKWEFGNRYTGIGEEIRDEIVSALRED